jgi:hypothetical protein
MKAFYSEKGGSKVLRNSVNFAFFSLLITEDSKLNIPVYNRKPTEKEFFINVSQSKKMKTHVANS